MWKELVMLENNTIEDLFNVDSLCANWLKKIAGSGEEEFEGMKLLWECTGCSGEGTVLKIGKGKGNTLVKWSERNIFCKRVVKARFDELKNQIKAIGRGFWSIIPQRGVALFQANEIEILTCGIPEFDMDLWKRNTNYSGGYHEGDKTIKLFWIVLESMTDEQKSNLVR